MSRQRIGRIFRAEELIDGDCIDLRQLPYFDRLDFGSRALAESEYARLIDESDDLSGAVIRETRDCVVIQTDQGCFGVDPSTPFRVHDRDEG